MVLVDADRIAAEHATADQGLRHALQDLQHKTLQRDEAFTLVCFDLLCLTVFPYLSPLSGARRRRTSDAAACHSGYQVRDPAKLQVG